MFGNQHHIVHTGFIGSCSPLFWIVGFRIGVEYGYVFFAASPLIVGEGVNSIVNEHAITQLLFAQLISIGFCGRNRAIQDGSTGLTGVSEEVSMASSSR